MSTPTISERFSANMSKLLQVVSDIVEELYSEKLTVSNADSVKVAAAMVTAFDPKLLMYSIATMHESWRLIKEKDRTFIYTKLPEALSKNNLPINHEVFKIPFQCYKKLKTDPKWCRLDEDQLPVNQEDLDSIWRFMTSFVVLTCKYIYLMRNGYLTQEGWDSHKTKMFSSVNLERYGAMFEIDYEKC